MTRLHYKEDYPLAEKRKELIKTPTGKSLEEVTMDNLLTGHVTIDDCRISKQTLEYQAEISESAGNYQLAQNLRRAAELTGFDDDRVLLIYSSLRPYRSSKRELEEIAENLEKEGAILNAVFIREAIEIYQKRKKFREDKISR